MVAIKRRARAKMAKKTHALDDRRLYNIASNKLKTAHRNLPNDSFANQVSTLGRDNSIWKPIKSRKTPKHHCPQFVKILYRRGLGLKETQKKSSYSQIIKQRCLPHIIPRIQKSKWK
jgi:hypothetical protein